MGLFRSQHEVQVQAMHWRTSCRQLLPRHQRIAQHDCFQIMLPKPVDVILPSPRIVAYLLRNLSWAGIKLRYQWSVLLASRFLTNVSEGTICIHVMPMNVCAITQGRKLAVTEQMIPTHILNENAQTKYLHLVVAMRVLSCRV